MDQPGKVSNPARGQLNRKTITPENLVSRAAPVCRVSLFILHTQVDYVCIMPCMSSGVEWSMGKNYSSSLMMMHCNIIDFIPSICACVPLLPEGDVDTEENGIWENATVKYVAPQ